MDAVKQVGNRCEFFRQGRCIKHSPINVDPKDWGCRDFAYSFDHLYKIGEQRSHLIKLSNNSDKVKRKLRYKIKKLEAELKAKDNEIERLKAFIRKNNPENSHDHDYYHDDCSLCDSDKRKYEKIEEFNKKHHIVEIAYDRWGMTQLSQDLAGAGYTMVPFGQGFASMAPSKPSG